MDKEKIKLEPGLYIVATPIGNLDDITIRSIKTLNSVDIILCENTKNSVKLLSHYGVKTKLSCYNDHSSSKERSKIISMIQSGKSIALISDAGTPLISDPGYKLVKELHENECYVTSCPGACSAINALSMSGLPTDSFSFEGFLPLKQKDRTSKFKKILDSKSTAILFDTGNKLNNTLEDMMNFFGDIEISILREMTKKFEERISDNISQIIKHHKGTPFKGEIVMLIPPQISTDNLSSLKNDLKILKQDKSNSSKDIVKILSFKYPEISKKEIYGIVHH